MLACLASIPGLKRPPITGTTDTRCHTNSYMPFPRSPSSRSPGTCDLFWRHIISSNVPAMPLSVSVTAMQSLVPTFSLLIRSSAKPHEMVKKRDNTPCSALNLRRQFPWHVWCLLQASKDSFVGQGHSLYGAERYPEFSSLSVVRTLWVSSHYTDGL